MYVSALGDIAGASAFLRAHALEAKASKAGFAWPDARSVLEKIREELEEVDRADSAHEKEELGDLLLATVTLVCFLKTEPQGLIVPVPEASAQASIESMGANTSAVETALAASDMDAARGHIAQLLAEITRYAQDRHIDAQSALDAANRKFIERFDYVGKALHIEGTTIAQASLETLLRLWGEAKYHYNTEI